MLKYIYAIEPNEKLRHGIETKITGQVNALNKLGIKAIKEGHVKEPKIKRALPLNTSSIDWTDIELSGVDSLYIRYHLSDFRFVKFLRKAKKHNITVCIEVPTFPYQKELKWYSIKSIRDRIYKRKLKEYVDHVFYMGGDGQTDAIFGVNCERICNGIDFDNYHIHKIEINDDVIRLIAVAAFQKSHGYERIIEGIAMYYGSGGSRRIEFYMVGEGEEKAYYEQLASDLKLENVVHFTGGLTGSDLDKAYDNANIGVEVFGFYKRHIDTSSSLKSREYLARGIPFICGAANDAIDESFPYCLFFPNDESIVDMNKVIEFYDRIYQGSQSARGVAESIRDYGMNTVSWEKTMKPVSDFFQSRMQTTSKKNK